jgi:hypothetical protein
MAAWEEAGTPGMAAWDVAGEPAAAPAPAPKLTLPAALSSATEEEPAPTTESFTPVAQARQKTDRRDFFHTDGRNLTFHHAPKPERGDEPDFEIGLELNVVVEEIHFGNPRIRVMSSDPAPMNKMKDWREDKFAEYRLDVARISFGTGYKVWCAIGTRSNRLSYAMKRNGVKMCKCVVVEAPPPPEEEDVDLTYGASIQGIQLVP